MNNNNNNNKYDEKLFWKFYHNKYIRSVIFKNLQTMEIEYSRLDNYYLGNRVPFKYIHYLKWYLKRYSRRKLLVDRLLYGNGRSESKFNNLIISKQDICSLIYISTTTTSGGGGGGGGGENENNNNNPNENNSNLSILKLLYLKYSNQMNQIDLILKCIEFNNLNALKLFTQEFKELEISNDAMDLAIKNCNIEIVEYLISVIKISGVGIDGKQYHNKDVFKLSTSTSGDHTEITRLLLNNPQLYNKEEESLPIIEFRTFLKYNKEIQIEILKKNLVIKDTLVNINNIYGSNREFTNYEIILLYLESNFKKDEILSPQFKLYKLYIIDIIKSTYSSGSGGNEKNHEIISELILNLKEIGISKKQFLYFILENYLNLKIVQDLLSIHNSFLNFKSFIYNVIDENDILVEANLGILLETSILSNNQFTIQEKIELIEIFIIKNFKVAVNKLVNALYPFNGFIDFNQSKQLYLKLNNFNEKELSTKTNYNYLILKSYYNERIIENCELESLKEIVEICNSNLQNQVKIGKKDDIINFILENSILLNNNYFKNCIGQDDRIIAYLEYLFKIKQFKFYNLDFLRKIKNSVTSFTRVLALFKELNTIITKDTINSVVYDNLDNLSNLIEIIQMFSNLFSSNNITDLFNHFVELENIELLNLLLSNFFEFFLYFKYKVTTTNPILIKWFIENLKQFQKLNFSNLLDKLIEDSIVITTTTNNSNQTQQVTIDINSNIKRYLVQPPTFEFLLNFLISNNIYQLPPKKFNGDYDLDYISYSIVGLVKNYYDLNIDNIEIVNNCILIFKLIYKNNKLFYWDESLFINPPIFSNVDDCDQDNTTNSISDVQDDIILDLLNQKPIIIISKSSVPNKKQKQQPQKQTQQQQNSISSTTTSKVFNNYKYKNNLVELVQFGQVRIAIEWLVEKPILLELKQVKKIIKYYEFELVIKYFDAIKNIKMPKNDIIKLLECVQVNRFDVFNYLMNNYHHNITISKPALLLSLIKICANSNNIKAIDFLLNHLLFNNYSKSVVLALTEISMLSSNIELLNYLFDNNLITNQTITDSDVIFYKNNLTIPFLKNLKRLNK